MVDLTKTPDDLPIPKDDGSADHLQSLEERLIKLVRAKEERLIVQETG